MAYELISKPEFRAVGINIAPGSTGLNLASANGITTNTSSGSTGTVTSNTFTVYEEGTFVPTLFGASTAGTTTYVSQVGNYVRIGTLVIMTVYVKWSACTGTGEVRVGGIPFTFKNTTDLNPIGGLDISWATTTWPAGTTTISAEGNAGNTYVNFPAQGSAIVDSKLQMANNAGNIRFTMCFQV